jgi:hypothetical protein
VKPRQPSFHIWLAAKVGANWVLHKNTTRIRERYGENVVCLTQSRYAALKAEYEQTTGLSADGYFMPPGSPAKHLVLSAFPENTK